MKLFVPSRSSERAPKESRRRSLLRAAAGRVEPLETRIALATVNLVSGTIANGSVWLTGEIQRITGDATLPAGSTLTIQPGAVIQFNEFIGADLIFDGTVNALGTAGTGRILFTAVRDETGLDGVLGTGDDVSIDGTPNTTGGNGDWGHIRFGSTSTATLNNIEVRFGGTSALNAEFVIESSNVSLSNSVIRNSSTNGVRISASNPTLATDTFLNNAQSAISMDLASNPAITAATATNNGFNSLTLDAGTLTSSRLWNDPSIVYRVAGDITVAAGATLTIGAGQIVKVRPFTGDDLIINGTLVADGAPGQPIIFTSDRDDTAGGDTNNNGATTGGNGDWNTITFGATSSGNLLDNVEIRYGGTGSTASVVLNSAPLTLTNSVIRNSSTSGLRIVGSDPVISVITFQDNNASAITMDLASNPAISGVTMINNVANTLTLDPGLLTGARIWNDPDIVYRIAGDITVDVGATLTIGAGQIVKVRPFTGDDLFINGTLIADGTPGQPIIITSDRDDTAGGDTNNNGATVGGNGDWNSLTFGANSTGNVLDNVQVRFAGTGSAAAIVLNGNVGLSLTNSTIRASNSNGLRIIGSDPTISAITFQDNFQSAISMDLASNPAITGVTMMNNVINGLTLDNGTLSGNRLWNDPDIVYRIAGDITVAVGATLTIGAGQIVKVRPFTGDDLIVNGTLIADGTGSGPIIFTSDRDDTAGGDTNNNGVTTGGNGDWNTITFGAGSTGNVLDNVDARFGGTGAAAAVVLNANVGLTLTNSVIRSSNTAGLRIVDSDPTISAVTFQNNFASAISMDLVSDPDITAVTMVNNAFNCLTLDAGTLSGSQLWNDPDIVYRIAGDITVAAGATLTIGAGQIVKVRPFAGDDLIIDGTLIADGTEAAPIIITSERDDTVAGDTNNNGATTGGNGDWNTITFNATSTANVMDNVEVRFGGAGSAASVVINSAPLTLTNSVIRNSVTAGLRIVTSNPEITATAFQNNFQAAISMDLASNPTITNATLTNNVTNALALDPGTLTGSRVWDDPGIVYRLSGDVTIAAGATLAIAPGQIVKARSFAGDDLIVNGTLLVNGSADLPVIFTSDRDDTAGGDTNNNGPTTGNNGDWNGFIFNTGSTGSILSHMDARFGGAINGGTLVVTGAGASVTVQDSIIRSSAGHALLAKTSANLTATSNLLFKISDTGIRVESGATVTAFNNTIDGNFRGVAADGAGTTLTLTNSLVTNNTNAGVVLSGGAVITAAFNDVFNTTNYSGLASQTGLNGNISADPKYFNRANSQFGLRAGSPAIDSGTSTGAPAADFFGNDRFDDPNVLNLGAGSQTFYDRGAIERQEISTSDIDLRALTVSGPTTGLQGQNVTVNWTVDNLGPAAVLGSWFDAVYLSADPIFTPDDLFLGEALHSGDLAPGASYAGSKQVTLPGVLPGDYYFIVRSNSKNEIFEAQALLNNAVASAQVINMDLPTLTVGVPLNATLPATGSALFYKINAPAGADLALALDGPNSGFTNELYLSFGELPSRQSFDERGIRPSLADQSVSVAGTQAGQYYAMVYGASLPGSEHFTLTATLAGFGITSISPARGSNTGEVTIAISGSQFDANSQPQIIDDGGQTILPSRVLFTDSGLLSATFDLTGRSLGLADVQVVNTGNVVTTLPNSLNIVAGSSGQLSTNIIVPSRIRLGRDFTVYVELSNTGDTDLLAPVLELREQGAGDTLLSFTPDLADAASSLLLLGANSTGIAGVLSPGAKVRIPIYGQATGNGDTTFELRIANYPNAPIDYGVIEGIIRPPGLTDLEWDPIFAQIQTSIGTTWDSYSERLAENATLLPPELGLNYSLADVFSLELARARAALGTSVTGSLFLGDTDHLLANTRIELVSLSTGDAFSAVSLNDGTYLFPIVPAGTYVAEFDGFVPVGAAPVVVGAGDLSNVNFTLTQGATIRGGLLVSAGGIPLPDMTVIATSALGDIFTTTTDSQGRYEIHSLPSGTYTVSAGGGSFSFANFAVGALTAGQQRDHVNLALGPAGTIQGIVSGPGGPLVNAVVNAVGSDGLGFGVRTDATGAFSIDGLKPQLYTLTASANGLVTTEIGGVNLATATTLTGINFSLTTGGGVQGALTAAIGGAAIPFLMLTLEKGAAHFTTQADENGLFKSLDLAPGTYTVTASGGNFMTTSGQANITAGNLTTLNLALSPLGTISGTVTNTNNSQGLAKVVVHAVGVDGTIYTDVTDASGNYALPGLDAGAYKVVFGDPGTPGLKSAMATLGGGVTTADVDFGVGVSGIFEGTVFAANGTTPLSNAIVTLSQGGQSILSYPVEADGTYSFIIVAPGNYQIEATGDGLSFPILSGLTASGTQTGLNFTAGSRAISGTIRDSGNAPLGGADVILLRTDAGAVSTSIGAVVTAPDGTFTISGVVDGTYRLVARDDDFGGVSQTVIVSGGNPAPVNVTLAVEAQVTGTIRDAVTSAPLANATVQAINKANPSISAQVVTNASGQYQLDGLPAGNYDIVVIADGHESASRTEVFAAGANVAGVSLATTGASVSGTITNGSHALEGVFVFAVNSAGLVLGADLTAADGSYAIPGLPAGSYSIVASAGGHQDESPILVNLSAGQSLPAQHFTFDPAAVADPSGGIGSTIADAAGGVSGWLRSVLVSVERSPRQPTSADLAPFLDMANCPVESKEAIQAVTNAERKFRDWQYVQENLDGVLGTARELGFAGLQIANAAGKIFLTVQSAAASAALAGASKVKQLLFELVLPLATDLANVRTTLDSVNRGESLDIPGAATILNDANTKATTLRTKLLEAKEALIKSAQTAQNSLGNLSLQEIERTKTVLGHLAKAIGIIDAGLASAAAITQSLDAYSRFTDQFAQFKNAREVYITAVGRANAAISFLKECKTEDKQEPEPIPPPDTKIIHTTPPTQIRSSFDPNDKHGPIGFDDPTTTGVNEGFIQPGTMPFEVEFENIGQIAAQIVVVTDLLDMDLDLTTFEFTGFGFSNREFTVPAGLTHYETTLDLRPDGIELLVPVILDLNTSTRLVTVTFKTLDPLTMLAPEGFEGFLPPDNANHDGEGFFTYIVSPKATVSTDDVITNQATIVFDDNAPILTPTTTNTFDIDTPSSVVSTLPATTLNRTFEVSWTGSDTGSGIEKFDLFVSVDGGAFAFHSSHTGLSTMFTGEREHTYAFYTVAGDNVGLTEATPATADSTVEILPIPLITAVGNKVILTDTDGDIYTVRLTGPTTAVLKYATSDPDGAGALNGPLDLLVIENSTIKNSLIVTVKRKADGPDLDKLPDGDGIVSIGNIAVTGALGAVKLTKSDLIGTGFTATGTVKSFTVRDIAPVGGAAEFTIQGLVTDKTTIKARTIADNFTLSTPGILTSLVAADVGFGNIEAVSIGKLQTTAGAFDADVTTPGAIGKIITKGGGVTGQLVAQRFGPITITLGDFSGEITSTTPALTLDKLPALKSLKISQGDLTGDIRVLGNIGAIQLAAKATQLGGNLTGGSITAAKIASLIVAKNVADSIILAGADLGTDHAFGGSSGDADIFAAGSIGTVNIKGTVTGGIIGAGFSSTDAIFKNGDDSIIGGTASVIASLIVKGGADDSSYFAAGLFKRVPKFLGLPVDLTGSDDRFLVG